MPYLQALILQYAGAYAGTGFVYRGLLWFHHGGLLCLSVSEAQCGHSVTHEGPLDVSASLINH